MNIAISGYTAAGKTTHARLLAEALGYDLVWAARILLERLGFDLDRDSESQLWFHHYAQINERRESLTVDQELDAYLAERVRTAQTTVFDARFLPWAADAPCLRVWLGSDLPSRARKCHVSLGVDAPPVPDCAVHVHRKDGLDVARVAATFGAVFGPDPERFDIVVDNSLFIPEATARSACAGTVAFDRYLHAAVLAAGGDEVELRALQQKDPVEFAAVVHRVRGVRL